jgi:hypothetical protein
MVGRLLLGENGGSGTGDNGLFDIRKKLNMDDIHYVSFECSLAMSESFCLIRFLLRLRRSLVL